MEQSSTHVICSVEEAIIAIIIIIIIIIIKC
jgi:hypothetical protein